jgi:hypothetical protein
LLLESVATGTQGHSSEWIARDIKRVILEHQKTSFADAVADNTSANKKAWLLLKEDFPSKYLQGCMSHGLNLLVKDIFGVTKKKNAGDSMPTYPVDDPFSKLLYFAVECKDIVKFFFNHHTVNTRLSKIKIKPALGHSPGLQRLVGVPFRRVSLLF